MKSPKVGCENSPPDPQQCFGKVALLLKCALKDFEALTVSVTADF